MATTLPGRVDTTELLPTRLSPSRAKDFMQCPKLFYYKTILGIATPPTIHTLKGNIAHIAFERVFDHPRGQRTVETALPYLEPALRLYELPLATRGEVSCEVEARLRDHEEGWAERDDGPDGPSSEVARKVAQAELNREVIAKVGRDELLTQARATVEGYFRMENPNVFDPHAREIHVQATALGVTMHGFIDRLDRLRDREGNERFVISDYKTGKPKQAGDRYLDETFFQLRVYALLLRELHGETPALLRLIYTSGGHPRYICKEVVTDQLLDATAAKVKSVWAGIRKAARDDRWATKRGPLCNWCYFQDVCPEFNDGAESLLPEERALRQGLLG